VLILKIQSVIKHFLTKQGVHGKSGRKCKVDITGRSTINQNIPMKIFVLLAVSFYDF
jgi:hypothetical protein